LSPSTAHDLEQAGAEPTGEPLLPRCPKIRGARRELEETGSKSAAEDLCNGSSDLG